VTDRNANIDISAKVASNHGAILKKALPAIHRADLLGRPRRAGCGLLAGHRLDVGLGGVVHDHVLLGLSPCSVTVGRAVEATTPRFDSSRQM